MTSMTIERKEEINTKMTKRKSTTPARLIVAASETEPDMLYATKF